MDTFDGEVNAPNRPSTSSSSGGDFVTPSTTQLHSVARWDCPQPLPRHDAEEMTDANIGLHMLEDPPIGEKPPYSFPVLIRCAILGSPRQKLTLNQIYTAIQQRYPYFTQAGNGWKNSIRHNLSLNNWFKRIPRGIYEPGKGEYWTVDLDSLGGNKRPRKRGSSKKDKASDETSPNSIPKNIAIGSRSLRLVSPFGYALFKLTAIRTRGPSLPISSHQHGRNPYIFNAADLFGAENLPHDKYFSVHTDQSLRAIFTGQAPEFTPANATPPSDWVVEALLLILCCDRGRAIRSGHTRPWSGLPIITSERQEKTEPIHKLSPVEFQDVKGFILTHANSGTFEREGPNKKDRTYAVFAKWAKQVWSDNFVPKTLLESNRQPVRPLSLQEEVRKHLRFANASLEAAIGETAGTLAHEMKGTLEAQFPRYLTKSLSILVELLVGKRNYYEYSRAAQLQMNKAVSLLHKEVWRVDWETFTNVPTPVPLNTAGLSIEDGFGDAAPGPRTPGLFAEPSTIKDATSASHATGGSKDNGNRRFEEVDELAQDQEEGGSVEIVGFSSPISLHNIMDVPLSPTISEVSHNSDLSYGPDDELEAPSNLVDHTSSWETGDGPFRAPSPFKRGWEGTQTHHLMDDIGMIRSLDRRFSAPGATGLNHLEKDGNVHVHVDGTGTPSSPTTRPTKTARRASAIS